jgi:hypothetical protein
VDTKITLPDDPEDGIKEIRELLDDKTGTEELPNDGQFDKNVRKTSVSHQS